MTMLAMLRSLGSFIKRRPAQFRNVMLAVIGVCALFLLIDTSAALRSLQIMVEGNKPPSHERMLSTEVSVQRDITTILDTVRKNSGAARGYVFQFHNGAHSIGGVNFARQSNTHEVVAQGVSPEINRLQNMSLRDTITWLPGFLANRCVHEVVGEITDPLLRALLDDQGIERLIACPVFFKGRAEPVGYVGLDWTTGYTPTTLKLGGSEAKTKASIETDLRAAAVEIAAALIKAKGGG